MGSYAVHSNFKALFAYSSMRLCIFSFASRNFFGFGKDLSFQSMSFHLTRCNILHDKEVAVYSL